ncbi:MAG: hypothetical protein RSD67_06300 [Oscillospiraceae bacterium]
MENLPKKNNCWKVFAFFLLGIIIGFSFAPIKNGMSWTVSNCGNIGKRSSTDDFSQEDCPNEELPENI